MTGINLVLDTNIIIYFLKGQENTKSLILDNDISISYITALETLGYQNNKESDIKIIKELFSTFKIIYSNE